MNRQPLAGSSQALCRDCLNNIGWDFYLRRQYDEALPWFEQACWLAPSPDDEMAHEHIEDLEPPYKLALENVLLCLARLGRLPEAAKKLTAYFDRFGRLPRYETEALRKLGLDADVAYIRRQIEKRTKVSCLASTILSLRVASFKNVTEQTLQK